jgi:hypothetical protein
MTPRIALAIAAPRKRRPPIQHLSDIQGSSDGASCGHRGWIMPLANRLNCRKAGVMAASVLGLGAAPQDSHAEDRVLAQTGVFVEHRPALPQASLAALDHLVSRIKAIAPELVRSSGGFRDEEPELVEVSGCAERAEAVKAYLVEKGVDAYRVRLADFAGCPGDDRRVSIRLVTFAPQKSFGSRGNAGLRFSR